jgi:hypothetical protein
LLARTLDQLEIEDEPSFRPVGLYADLKDVLLRARYPFRVLPPSHDGRWDRALLLNLTYWGATGGGDVLVSSQIAADVVTHAAWHHLAGLALAPASGPMSVDALFVGEAIASAFDVYLVGRLLGHAPGSTFLESQVPAMADAADAAGLSADDFEALLASLAEAPERAFADLCFLLFDATSALYEATSADDGLAALAALDGHRFAPLLHHYELSTWVLYARAYGAKGPDERARGLVAKLRTEADPLAWLDREWVRPNV